MDFLSASIDIWTFLAVILSIITTGIIIYTSFFWKYKVYIVDNLGKDEKIYTTVKTAYVYRVKDVFYWKDRAYFLNNPTFLVGTKRFYIFEKNNSTPLTLNEKAPINALKVKHLIRDNVIGQLIRASYVPPIKIKDIIIILAIALIVIFAFVYIFPMIFPTTTSTTTSTPIPTITPKGV